jgi:hypothetical protein
MPLIVNVGSPGSIVNQSNIALSAAKLAAMPQGWHEIDGYTERRSRDDTLAARLFEGPWSGIDAFAQWALGYTTVFMLPQGQGQEFDGDGTAILTTAGGGGGTLVNNITPGGTAYLSRTPPAQHPRIPWAYCVEFEVVRGQGAYRDDPTVFLTDNEGNQELDQNGNPIPVPLIGYYDSSSGSDAVSALVRLTYRDLDYIVMTDQEVTTRGGPTVTTPELARYVHRKVEPTAAFLPLPKGVITFVSGPQAGRTIDDNTANVILFRQELTYTWIDVPAPPFDAFKACTGHVNQADFDGARGFPLYPAGTLLCQAPRYTRRRTPLGMFTYDVEYHFLYNPDKWNFLPANNGTFYQVSYDGTATGAGLYPTADFNTLFLPGQPGTVEGP